MTTKAPTNPRRPVAKPEPELAEFTTSDPKPEAAEERRPLFTIDGQEFTVPNVIDERLTFLAMNYLRSNGAIFAAMYLTELLLGEPQFKQVVSLYERKRITKEQFDKINELVNGLFFDHMKAAADDTGEEAGKA